MLDVDKEKKNSSWIEVCVCFVCVFWMQPLYCAICSRIFAHERLHSHSSKSDSSVWLRRVHCRFNSGGGVDPFFGLHSLGNQTEEFIFCSENKGSALECTKHCFSVGFLFLFFCGTDSIELYTVSDFFVFVFLFKQKKRDLSLKLIPFFCLNNFFNSIGVVDRNTGLKEKKRKKKKKKRTVLVFLYNWNHSSFFLCEISCGMFRVIRCVFGRANCFFVIEQKSNLHQSGGVSVVCCAESLCLYYNCGMCVYENVNVSFVMCFWLLSGEGRVCLLCCYD